MRNKYPGPCADCGARTPADGGEVARDAAGKWAICCDACLAKVVAAQEAPAAAPVKIWPGSVAQPEGPAQRNRRRMYPSRAERAALDRQERAAVKRTDEFDDIEAFRAAFPLPGETGGLDL